MIVASMATIPERIEGLRAVVGSIYPQVDQLNVFLDRYPEVPKFLAKPNIQVERSQDRGYWGDAGKFYWCDQVKGIHFTLDDDIIYPKDYVSSTLDGLVRFEGRVLGGYHGNIWHLSDGFMKGSCWNKRRDTCFSFSGAASQDVQVHKLGTGVFAYVAKFITILPTDFLVPNMADVWVALLAQQQRKPMICFQHQKNWIRRNNSVTTKTIGLGRSVRTFSIDRSRNVTDVLDKIVQETRWVFPEIL